MAPALLTSPPTNGPVLVDISSSALPGKLSSVVSISLSPNDSEEHSPNTLSKISGSVINIVPDAESFETDDTITGMSTKILDIIFDYALNKFDDSRDRLEAGRTRFIEVLNEFVGARSQIAMALPAFPFKSANKVYKALGFLPDKAEELSLSRLHNMCRRIEEIYEPGAHVVIISDGLVYNGWFHAPYL
jgi:hypothetical protein